MKTKFEYFFDKDSGILYKNYFGPITIQDIWESWDHAIENKLIPEEVKGIILDYREASFDIKLSEYYKIAEYYKNHIDVFRNYKIAIVTQSQKDVMIPTLVESKDDGYISRPFYSIDAARRWVLI